MKYSICGDLVLRDLPVRERLKAVAQLEGASYEFWTWQDKNLQEYRDLSLELGVKISALSGDDAYSMSVPQEAEAYLDFFNQSVDAAAFLQADTLIVHTEALEFRGDFMPAKSSAAGLSDGERFEACVTRLKDMAAIAEKKQINIALEALNTTVEHPGYYADRSDVALRIIRAVGHERVKMLFDIYHMQIMEGNVIQNLCGNVQDIGYVHVADVPGRFEPGTGELYYPNILSALENSGYTGYVGFECKCSRGISETLCSMWQLTKR